jgi:hypothetical protein
MRMDFCASWIKAAVICAGLALCVTHGCRAADAPSITALAEATEKQLVAHGGKEFGTAVAATARQLQLHIDAIDRAIVLLEAQADADVGDVPFQRWREKSLAGLKLQLGRRESIYRSRARSFPRASGRLKYHQWVVQINALRGETNRYAVATRKLLVDMLGAMPVDLNARNEAGFHEICNAIQPERREGEIDSPQAAARQKICLGQDLTSLTYSSGIGIQLLLLIRLYDL